MNSIMFTQANHQFIRDLKKTETRRLTGLGKVNEEPDAWEFKRMNADGRALFWLTDIKKAGTCFCKPRFHEGEAVYIKETYYPCVDANQEIRGDCVYKLSKFSHLICRGEWKSPLFMPAWAARDFLLMLKVFPQRARDITPEQAVAEGFATPEAWGAEINARNPKEKPWDNNLWLFAYQFRLIKKDGVEL